MLPCSIVTASDAELLDDWRAGDAAAGRELFHRHGAAVQRFFRSKLGPDREDLIQRTFLACLESRDRVRDGSSFRTFLLGVARHKLYDHLERMQGPAGRFDPLVSTAMDLAAASPSAVIAREERRDAVLDAMQRLPIELQLVLELHYWEELETAEIALVLDIPRGTVKTRLMRARERLRELLARQGGPDADAGVRALGRALATNLAEP
jgi:RNA polymerase sigma factor (sigma-70 family)